MTAAFPDFGVNIVISLDVQPNRVAIHAAVVGRFNARYSRVSPERVAGEVQALVADILGELRAQSLLEMAHA